MAELLTEVLDAHGGIDRWNAASTIRARVITGGMLPRTRFPGTRLTDGAVEVSLRGRTTSFDPFPQKGQRGVFDSGNVRIESADGELIEFRDDPRPEFFGLTGLRRNLRWDALDTVYFAGYAIWNYLATPWLLTLDGVNAREIEPLQIGAESWRALAVEFPAAIETHSSHQTFYFDDRALLRRHDYVAEVVGGWARAAHLCDDHVEADGLTFPSRRRVRPKAPGNRVFPFPTLVAADLSEVEVQ